MTVLQFATVHFIVLNTYTTAIGYVYADVDATKYLLELVATSPMYRNTTEIILLLTVRLFVHGFIFSETFRIVGYLFCFGLLIIYRIRLVITTLFRTSNVSLYFQYYRQCLLIYRLMYFPIQFFVYMSLTVAFWFTVFLVWACIKFSPSTVSTIVYTWQAMLLVGLCTVGFMVLSDLCNTMEIAVQAVIFQRLRAKLRFCKRQTKLNKINYYHVRSVHPLRISYGFFGWLGRDFIGEFTRVLTLRCFDVIMIF